MSNKSSYLLLLKADEFLRDRCTGAALRLFEGPVFGMNQIPQLSPIRFFDNILRGDPHRPADALRAVQEWEGITGQIPAGVIPVTEMSLESAACIAQAYSLPFLSPETVRRCRDKSLMRMAFSEAGVSSPRFRTFENLEELRSASKEIGFPLILKPVSAAHSIGVILVRNRDDLEAAFQFSVSNLREIQEAWGIRDERFQVEEYVQADREVSVEVVCDPLERRVIALTEKYLTPPPFFAEIGHMVPGVDPMNTKVRKVALDACRALGIDRGVAHVELRIDGNGDPFVIEVAARPGGDGIMDLVERAHGINMYRLHISSYLGLPLGLPAVIPTIGVAAVAFARTQPGYIHKVRTDMPFPPEVKAVYPHRKEGDVVQDSLNYDDRAVTMEFFWPNEKVNQGVRHLDLVQNLCDEMFQVSNALA